MPKREVEHVVTISGQIYGETLQDSHRKFTMNDPQITVEKVIFNSNGQFKTIQLYSIRRKERPNRENPLISTITIEIKVCLHPRANHVALQTIRILKKTNGDEAKDNYHSFKRRDVHALKNLVREFILEKYGESIKQKILEPLSPESLAQFVNLMKLRGGGGESAEDEEEAQVSANVDESEEPKGVEASVHGEEANDTAVIKQPEELKDDAEVTEDQENDAQYSLWMFANINLDQTQDPAKYILSHPEIWVSPISGTGDSLISVTLPEESNSRPNNMLDFAVWTRWMVRVTRDDQGSVSEIYLRDHKGELLGAEVPVETKWAVLRLAAEYLLNHRQEVKDTIDPIGIVRFSGNDFEGYDGQYHYFISPTEMPYFPLCDTTELMKMIAEEHMKKVDRQENGYPWLQIHGLDEFELLCGLADLGITGTVVETNGKLFRIRDDEDESESDTDVSELNITSSVNETKSKTEQKEDHGNNAAEQDPETHNEKDDDKNLTSTVMLMDLEMHVGIVIDNSQQPPEITLYDPKVWIHSTTGDKWGRAPIPTPLLYQKAARSTFIKPKHLMCLSTVLRITQAENKDIKNMTLTSHEILGEISLGNIMNEEVRAYALVLAANFLNGVRELIEVKLDECVKETPVNAFVSEYDRVLSHLRQDCGENIALQEEDGACLCGSCPLLDPCGDGR